MWIHKIKVHPFITRGCLILISFVAWVEPENYQSMEEGGPFLAARYANISYSDIPMRQVEIKIRFYLHKESIQHNVVLPPLIEIQAVKWFRVITKFKVGPHHMYVQTQRGPNKQWLVTHYKHSESYAIGIVEECNGDFLSMYKASPEMCHNKIMDKRGL